LQLLHNYAKKAVALSIFLPAQQPYLYTINIIIWFYVTANPKRSPCESRHRTSPDLHLMSAEFWDKGKHSSLRDRSKLQ